MQTVKIASATAILFLFSLTVSYGADVAKIGCSMFKKTLYSAVQYSRRNGQTF